MKTYTVQALQYRKRGAIGEMQFRLRIEGIEAETPKAALYKAYDDYQDFLLAVVIDEETGQAYREGDK